MFCISKKINENLMNNGWDEKVLQPLCKVWMPLNMKPTEYIRYVTR